MYFAEEFNGTSFLLPCCSTSFNSYWFFSSPHSEEMKNFGLQFVVQQTLETGPEIQFKHGLTGTRRHHIANRWATATIWFAFRSPPTKSIEKRVPNWCSQATQYSRPSGCSKLMWFQSFRFKLQFMDIFGYCWSRQIPKLIDTRRLLSYRRGIIELADIGVQQSKWNTRR